MDTNKKYIIEQFMHKNQMISKIAEDVEYAAECLKTTHSKFDNIDLLEIEHYIIKVIKKQL